MNPKDIYGFAKVPLTLNSPMAEILCAMGFKIGAEKYGEYNYRVAKVQSRVYLEALRRHVTLLLDGEDFDRDTGYPHLCFVLACASIVADAWLNGFLIDTRPLPGRAGELIAALNQKPGEPPRTPDENMEIFRRLLKTPRDTRFMVEHGDAKALAKLEVMPTDGKSLEDTRKRLKQELKDLKKSKKRKGKDCSCGFTEDLGLNRMSGRVSMKNPNLQQVPKKGK
jgi:hypothetical protein